MKIFSDIMDQNHEIYYNDELGLMIINTNIKHLLFLIIDHDKTMIKKSKKEK